MANRPCCQIFSPFLSSLGVKLICLFLAYLLTYHGAQCLLSRSGQFGWVVTRLFFRRDLFPMKLWSAMLFHMQRSFFFLSTIPGLPSQRYKEVEAVRWLPAPVPHITINTDGSSRGNPGPSGAGGLARSASGSWLWGSSLRLGVTNNTMAELWGIRRALMLAWDKGYRGLLFKLIPCLQLNG